jgi:predicted PurR-regulated permease PerM
MLSMAPIGKSAISFGILLLAILFLLAIVAVLVLATDFVMLIFLAILFGVFLTKTSGLLGHFVPLAYYGNLALVTTVLSVAVVGSIFLFGAKIESRLDEASNRLDQSVEKLDRWLQQSPTASELAKEIPYVSELLDVQSGSNPPSNDERNIELSFSEPDSSLDIDDAKKIQPADRDSKDPRSEQSDSNAPNRSSNSGGSSHFDVLGQTDLPAGMIEGAAGRVFSVLKRIFGTTLGLIANLGVIFFIGIFLAVEPSTYRNGFALVFPTDRRDRVVEVMDKMGDALYSWLNGRFLAMLITGTGTAVALLVLGVPMPLTIGVITGVLTFIPNIGSIIALSIATLMALTQGPIIMLLVIVLYTALQLVESNIVTPLIQKRLTSIPPALLLGFQVIMGAMTGFLGILIATPFLAGLLVLIQEVWIKDILGDRQASGNADHGL